MTSYGSGYTNKKSPEKLNAEFAREHGRVTMGDAIRLTGTSRDTLKQHFRALTELGHLNQHGSGRGVWYDLR